MKGIFDPVYRGEELTIFSQYHIYAMVFICISWFVILFVGHVMNKTKNKNAIRISIVVCMIFIEVSWHVWAVYAGVWHVSHALPLHLCSLGAILSIYMLLQKSYRTFEVLYFWSCAGAAQAILTPDLRGYNYPSFHYFCQLTS